MKKYLCEFAMDCLTEDGETCENDPETCEKWKRMVALEEREEGEYEALEEVRKYFVVPQYPMTIIIRRTKQGNFNVQKVEEGE